MLHPRLWRDDHLTAQCTACAAVFTLFHRRRHHCRHCGGVFCAACTTKRLWLRPGPPVLSRHVESNSAKRALAEMLVTPGVVTPITAVATPFSNPTSSLRDANSSASGTSKNEARRSVTTMTTATSHHRDSNSERYTSSSAEAERPASPPKSASRPRSEGSGLVESRSYRLVSATSIAAASEVGQTSQTPSQSSSHTPEAQSVYPSHWMPSRLFSSSIDVIAPFTTTGDASSQAWTKSEAMGTFEQGSSSHLLRGSSVTVGGEESGCTLLMSDSLLNQCCLSEHQNDQQQNQQGVAAGDDSALDSSPETRNDERTTPGTASATTRGNGSNRGDSTKGILVGEENAYRRKSYKVEVDSVQCITWYLCRVCCSCYDHLVNCIIDAHEAPAIALHSRSRLPLSCYVRLCSSGEPLSTDGRTGDPHQWRVSGTPPRATSCPTPAGSVALASWLSIWTRVRASVSLLASYAQSTMALPAMTAAATPPPSSSLHSQTHDLCQARGTANSQVSGKTNSTATAAQTSAGFSGSGCISPVSHESSRGDDSILSLSAQPGIASLNMASAQPQSPQLQQRQQSSSSRRARRVVTPPRRLLISIDGSPGPLRQAVALARRRRRIAVILIDERDLAAADDGTKVQQQQQQQYHEAPCGALSALLSAGPDTETAPQPSAITEQSGSMRSADWMPSIAAAAEATSLVFQHTESNKDDAHQQSHVAGDTTAPVTTTKASAQRPKLSILVDDVTFSDADGTTAVSTSCSSADTTALRGLAPAAWLLPQLPLQAVAPVNPMTATRAPSATLFSLLPYEHASLGAAVSSSVGAAATTACPAISRPISCVPEGSQAVVFPVHSTGAATTPKMEGKLRALPVTLDSGMCVLRALFSQIGAVVRRSSTLATTACATTTPTSAATAASGGSGFPLLANTTGAGSLFTDPANCGSARAIATPLWSAGPESYAAQRQALVRDMIMRYQLGPGVAPSEVVTSPLISTFISNAYTPTADQNDPAHWCGTTGHRGAPGGFGTGSSGYVNATCRRVCGCPTTASYERVTAPVTTYLHLRPPAAAVTILPVSTQVEVVGIPIDTSAVTDTAATTAVTPSAVSAVSPGHASPHARGGDVCASSTVIPGLVAGDTGGSTSRPFTMTELLPQLAKLSTNLDGYVIVILRRQSSRYASGDDRTSLGGGTTATRPGSNGNSAGHTSVAQMGGSNCSGVQQSADADRLASSPCVSFSLPEESKCSVPRSPQRHDPNQRQRRRHRVTELFGGQHIRLLYQQLQSCGVPQPAISVLEVSNEAELDALKLSPVHLPSGKSPLEEAILYRDELGTSSMPHPKARAATGGKDGVAEGWPGAAKMSSQNSALSASGISTASSVDSGSMWRPSSILMSTSAPSTQVTERTPYSPSILGDSLERMQLPASVSGGFGQTARLMNASTVSVAPPTALEQAMASLRCATRQLGVSMCSMTYTSATTPRTMGSAPPLGSSQSPWAATATIVEEASEPALLDSPRLRASHNAGGSGGDGALLTRPLESLVATLVYRDICRTLSQ
nr:unnamed protein product [Leishmania braziliensis]